MDVQLYIAIVQTVLIPTLIWGGKTLYNFDRRLYRVELRLGLEQQ